MNFNYIVVEVDGIRQHCSVSYDNPRMRKEAYIFFHPSLRLGGRYIFASGNIRERKQNGKYQGSSP